MLGHPVQNMGAFAVTADSDLDRDVALQRMRRSQQLVWVVLAGVGVVELVIGGWMIGALTRGLGW